MNFKVSQFFGAAAGGRQPGPASHGAPAHPYAHWGLRGLCPSSYTPWTSVQASGGLQSLHLPPPSGAFIKTFVSTAQFLLCVAHDDCATSAPGVGEHFYVAPAFFGAQAFFIIVAVAATPCSIAKGGMCARPRLESHGGATPHPLLTPSGPASG